MLYRRFSPAIILKRYQDSIKANGKVIDLKKFVLQNFNLPVEIKVKLPGKKLSLKKHLEELWPYLTRKADKAEKNSSLLPLPYPYVVPGGRFREIYYWDSYFTMLGLSTSNRYDLIENMLDNFSYLINNYGHIPNGNRSYYLSRSQPPYFALMVELLHEKSGDRVYKKYLPALQKEYEWWMSGADKLINGQTTRRVVKLEDGSVLNRYWDDKKAPREESYFQDVQTAAAFAGKDSVAFTHLRAGAESGWDFSSRWFADTNHLNTIETTNIIPGDLNCLLYAYEMALYKAAKSQQQLKVAAVFSQKALARKQAILKYCWNEKLQYFFDYNLSTKSTTDKWSLAGVLPMFINIADTMQSAGVMNNLSQQFLKPGGVVTTIYHTGEQWDAPNGWAPLQYLTVKALLNYKYYTLAKSVAERWMTVNEKVYQSTGKMLEKYNVENIDLPGGGGEYPTQDGFGWTNGVYLKFYDLFRK